MKQLIKILIAFAIVGMLVPTQYVKAVQYDEIVQEVNFQAITGADETQNNLDENAQTNYDTWDPVPQGVWFGGWPVESRLRLDDVPNTDFVVSMATVCRFGADIVMSGAARTLVRLPVHTSDDPWTSAYLNVYEIAEGTNWTYTRENGTASTFGSALGQMRINFTSGSHRLIFYSETYSPSDLSPTDGDDHFTRSNRTYSFVDAPLKPDVFYLFVTYVQYASDKYVEMYIQSDSLDSEGEWNRSSIAVYNEQAPDTYTLDIDNMNVSNGYSFDFRNGFGNSAYGLNVWIDGGDDLEFLLYQNLSNVDDTHYMTFHIPYRSTVDNISWDVALQEWDPVSGDITEFYAASNYIANDFLLISLDTQWSTCSTFHSLDLTGWFKIVLSIDNDTRIWLPLWDVGQAPVGARVDRSWMKNPIGGTHGIIWDSDNDPTYNLEMLIQHEKSGSEYYNYHWATQASLQWNDFYWTKNTPRTSGTEELDPTENMTLTGKIFYGVGGFFISAGSYLGFFNPGLGYGLRHLGTAARLVAVADVLPDFFGWALDGIQRIVDFFRSIGQWIWRAAQEVIGWIRWFVETVVYYASIILGLIVFIIALIILFTPAWFAAKFGQIIVQALRGRHDVAIQGLGDITGKAGALVGRGR